MPGPWQLCFDDGHQQRYLPDRQSVLRYVLAIGPKAASKRFEVYRESEAPPLPDGQPGGRMYTLAEVIDLSSPGEAQRLQAELSRLADEEPGGGREGLPSQPESRTSGAAGGPYQRRAVGSPDQRRPP
jgi:hypothetical protein